MWSDEDNNWQIENDVQEEANEVLSGGSGTDCFSRDTQHLGCCLPFRQSVMHVLVLWDHSSKHQAKGLSAVNGLQAEKANVGQDLKEQWEPHAPEAK